VSEKLGKPHGIVDVGLAAGHVLDMGGIRQDQHELAVIENMPDRFPIDAGRLHRHMVHSLAANHSDNRNSSAVVVPKVRTSLVTLPSQTSRTQATTEFL
jgi:hypothetical protein